MTDDIVLGFEAFEMVGVVLVDLTLPYDTVGHRGLNLKLLKLILNVHPVVFVIEMLHK